MTFSQQLNNFISILNCTAKELSDRAGLTPATLSRYCSGKRIPSADSIEIDKITNGICSIASSISSISDNKQLQKLCDYSYVKNCLTSSISSNVDSSLIINNFNTLINSLDINLNKLAKYLGYDSSFLYRIKTGQRKPGDTNSFVNNTCQYIVTNYNDSDSLASIAAIIGCTPSELSDQKAFLSKLTNWFASNVKIDNSPTINNFLSELDAFDLDEYIRTIHFDELKVPNVPFHLIHSKTYYELDGMKEAELDFYKGTVLSKTAEPIFMFSDMPMEDMAQDIDFAKKWMFAIGMSIKKGLHLNVIHNLNRPFNELLLGLQSWIPLYMTGQISPYYYTCKTSSVFHQLTYVSGVCALDGQCIDGHHKDGKYTLYSSKTDVKYYQKRAKNMLSKATSLMDIYFKEDSQKILDFIDSIKNEKGNYKSQLYSLPNHTMTKDFLERVLSRTGKIDYLDQLWEYTTRIGDNIKTLTEHSTLTEEVAVLSKEEFDKYTPTISFVDSSANIIIAYTYDEYLEHLKLTEEYADNNPNYIFVKNTYAPFRNIQIRIKEDSFAIISKKTSPAIHFVVHHPKLVNAIWNFVPLVNE